MRCYEVQDFIRATRPDGKGHIIIQDGEGNITDNIAFKEVICDRCNKELKGDDIVYADESGAYCEECKSKIDFWLGEIGEPTDEHKE